MVYVCITEVMDVVFSVCIVTRGAVGARVWAVVFHNVFHIITTIKVAMYEVPHESWIDFPSVSSPTKSLTCCMYSSCVRVPSES